VYEIAAVLLFGAYTGVALMLLSLVLYVARTGERRALGRLWCDRRQLTRLEGGIDRLGVVLALVGLVGSLGLRLLT